MKRILVLYVLTAALIVALAIPASAAFPEQWWNSNKGAVELFRVSATGGGGGGVPTAPAYIEYTLNCKADVTVEILPSDSTGIPTGDPFVRKEVLADQLKGKHTYLWPCIKDDSSMAPVGYYVAKLSATSTPSQWDANLGLFINWQQLPDAVPTNEYVYRYGTGNTWQPETAYTLDAYPRTVPTTPNGHRYRCSAAGTSDTLEPTWPTVQGATVADGSVTWTEDAIVMPRDTTQTDPAKALDNVYGGFYGIGVNHDPASPYYGRIYAPHQTNRDVYMYDVDGTFLGPMNDDGIAWATSAPWDCQVADDGYVFVSDRTNMVFYVFKPDGSAWISKSTVLTTNDRAIGVRTTSDGVDHCLICSGTEVYDVKATIVYDTAGNATGATWANRVWLYTATSSADTAYGMCANSDMTVIYQASRAGTQIGIRKWENIGGTWTMNPTWSGLNGTLCADVEIAADGNLWVTASRGYTFAAPSMYKLSAADGSIIASYDIITWGFMLARDAVGGVAVTFGKSTTTWPGCFWGMFAPPGEYSATKTTGAFYCPEDPAPVLVPGSEQWTYGSGMDLLIPNGADTASVSFQVIDANGFSDIGDIDLDLKELKTTDDSTPVVPPDTVVQNGSNSMIADCTKQVTAVNGTQRGAREIGVKPYDTHGSSTTGTMHVNIAANFIRAYVRHLRTGQEIRDATLYARGGKVGAYGYPFTYQSPATALSDATGLVELDVSQGSYQVWAQKVGYTPEAVRAINVPVVMIPATQVNAGDPIQLGPLSIQQAREFTRQTIYCSVQGLVYARPKGIAPTVCYGLDDRLDTATSATQYYNRRMWYMCDPITEYPAWQALTAYALDVVVVPTVANGHKYKCTAPGTSGATEPAWPTGSGATVADATVTWTEYGDPNGAAHGMQFQLKIPDPSFTRQWDDTALKQPVSGNSLYLGKRPDLGDTICLSGWLETRPGYETRLIVDDAGLQKVIASFYPYFYYNLTGANVLGYETKPLPTPVAKTVSQIVHADNASYQKMWGQYAEVTNAIPTFWYPTGLNRDGSSVADLNKYVVIADGANPINWSTVTFQTLTSLDIPPGTADQPPPVTLNDTYTFRGACGRRCRFGVGTIRPRGTADMTCTFHAPNPDPNSVGVVRGIVSGEVAFRGIVTAKFADSVYVENSDRSVGVKVVPQADYVSVGDEVLVIGDVSLVDGQKQVTTSRALTIKSSANALPELGIRHRDVGGSDYYNTWAATKAYKLGNLVVPTIWNGSRYACITDPGGTSGATEPTWPTGLNETVVDGTATVTWKNVGWNFIANPAADPGIHHPRGPFNVGLLVTVSGLVTYRDTAPTPGFFYIWDGSNMVLPGEGPSPLDDGTGHRGLRISNSGWLGAPHSRGVKAYQDWVTVNGVVHVKKLDVGAETIYIPAVLPKTVTLNTVFVPVHADAGTALTAATNIFALPILPAATGPGSYNDWVAETAYEVGNVVEPTNPDAAYKYECTVAGTSNTIEPIWPIVLNATVVDGTVTWKNVGTSYNGDPIGPLPFECPQVLAPTKDPFEVDGRVYRVESANLSQYTYDMWSEPNGWFGGMLLGDGYWVLLDVAWAVDYTGLIQTPQWIATCEPGAWVLIGHPQAENTETTDIQMSNGGRVLSFFDASGYGANWVQSIGFWWDNEFQNQYDIGLPDDWAWTTTMQPWHGYTFLMNEPNRAWIIPYTAPPPP